MDCSTPGLPVHHQLLQFTQTHVHWVSDAIQPSHPLSSPSPPSLNLSQSGSFPMNQFFASGGQKLQFQLQDCLSSEYSGLISFRMDWLDLLAVEGTLKSLLRHHISKASILWCSAFFIVQLSHTYMITGKTILWLDGSLSSKWCLYFYFFIFMYLFIFLSLLFNMLSRLIIAFLPRSKCLNFMAAVTISSDLGAQKNKVCQCFHCFPIYLPWSDETRCHDLSFWMLSFKPAFSFFSFTFSLRGSSVPLHFLP